MVALGDGVHQGWMMVICLEEGDGDLTTFIRKTARPAEAVPKNNKDGAMSQGDVAPGGCASQPDNSPQMRCEIPIELLISLRVQ